MLAAGLALSVLSPAGIANASSQPSVKEMLSKKFLAKAEWALRHHKHLSQPQRAAIAVHFAYQHIGDMYQWGGNGPHRWDCSGLVDGSWRAAGIHLPRISYEIYNAHYKHVSYRNLRPGDVLEFYSGMSHVGIYVGYGYMIQASHSGAPVAKARLAGYYHSNFSGAIRPGVR